MSQQNQDYSPTEEGLPEADDYDPDAIGTAELSAGESTQTFEEYGLEVVPVLHDGEDTGRRFIRRNGDYLADVSTRYRLLPNERAVAVANDVARDVGAVPFHDWGDASDDWYVQLDDHVYQDAERRRVHALYAFDEQIEVEDGDPVNVGFAVHNSIDASLSFQVGLFTYRHACANMVTMTVKNTQENTFDTGNNRFSALDVEPERDIIEHSSHYHTQGLEVDRDSLRSRIAEVVMVANEVIDSYEDWTKQALDASTALDLIERARGSGNLAMSDLPEWLQGAEEELSAMAERAEENDTSVSREEKENVVYWEIPEGETVWGAYNDVTESVWHDNGNQDLTKQRKYDDLHRVLEPSERV